MSATDQGRALRFIIEADGWTGPNDPEEFEKVHTADMAKLCALLTKVREHERQRIGRQLSAEANRIFNKQTTLDYPSNVLDRVVLHLRTGEPLEVRPEVYKPATPDQGEGTR